MNNYEYNFRLSYLLNLYKSLNYKTIVLFGAGTHTEWFLEKLIANKMKPNLILDEFSSKKSLLGINVTHPVKAKSPDIIFISSDTQEAKLKERAKYFFPNATIIAPYEKIGVGPFLNKSYSNIQNSNNMSIFFSCIVKF